MDWIGFGIACVKILANLTEWMKQRQWYQQGVADADAKANVEQQDRIRIANAARADADALAADSLHDTDGHRRD